MLIQEAGRKPEGDEEEKAAREIATSLGGLPLALELAGAYLKYRSVSWQQYRELLRHNFKGAMPERVGSFTKHEADLYSTLKINEEVFNEEPKLKEILDLLTWSGSAPMGESLMCALLNAANPVELTPALGLGTALRLLQKTPDADSYSIHRLVREVRREEIPLQEHQDWVDDVCKQIGDWFEVRRQEYTELSRFEAEIDHLQAWQGHAGHHAPEHSSRLIWLQAYPSYHQGHYQETKNWVEKALTLFERVNKSELELKAHLLNDLGFCYSSLGDYNRALEYSEKALKIRLELFGELHLETARSFNNVGADYDNLRDYKRGLEYAEKALEIRLDLFGERHPNSASSFNSVSADYSNLGDYKRALRYSEKALEIRLELLGDKHPDTIFSVINLVNILSNLNRHPEALNLSEKYLPKLSKDHIRYDELKNLQQILQAKPMPPGFRQQSGKPHGQSKKKRWKKR